MDQGQLLLGRARCLLADRGGEFRRLKGPQHRAKPVGTFRMVRAGVVFQASGVRDQSGCQVESFLGSPRGAGPFGAGSGRRRMTKLSTPASSLMAIRAWPVSWQNALKSAIAARSVASTRNMVSGRHGPEGSVGAKHGQWAVHAFDVEQGFAHVPYCGDHAGIWARAEGTAGPGAERLIARRKTDRSVSSPRESILTWAAMSQHRIGIDLGGTKIEIVLLGPDGVEVVRERIDTPSGYDATLGAIAALVHAAESKAGVTASVGIGIPGVISPATGRVKNANSIALNGHTFDRDISAALGRQVKFENDANCFALSEATDGAGAGLPVVFGVILGTVAGVASWCMAGSSRGQIAWPANGAIRLTRVGKKGRTL